MAARPRRGAPAARRARPGRPAGADPPVRLGAEHRVEPGPEARFSRSTDYLVPAGLRWSAAALCGPTAPAPSSRRPPGERGELIALPTRRAPTRTAAGAGPRPPRAADDRTDACRPLRGTAPPPPSARAGADSRAAPPGKASPPAARRPRSRPRRALARASRRCTGGRAAGRGSRRCTGPLRRRRAARDAACRRPRCRRWLARAARGLEHDLSQAAEAVLRARDSERATGEAVLAVLAGAQADLQAVRAARAADAALLATLAGQLEAERIAHAATREVAAGRRRRRDRSASSSSARATTPRSPAPRPPRCAPTSRPSAPARALRRAGAAQGAHRHRVDRLAGGARRAAGQRRRDGHAPPTAGLGPPDRRARRRRGLAAGHDADPGRGPSAP